MAPDSPRDLQVGDVVDRRYELRRDLGQGAAGRVFEAVHQFTRRSVALKLVWSDIPSKLRDELHARLLREARALASVRHPGVVDVLDGGFLENGTPFLVMELLDGRTLEGLIAARGKLSVADTFALALQLCDALDAAHAAGIVHRDVKPSNILVVLGHAHARREVLKLVDFGIARVEAPTEDKLTSVGALVGTPAYMAPEQLLALGDVDSTCDVYALGVTLFECLTGRMPYDGNYQQVLLQVCSKQPAPRVDAIAPEVPVALANVLHRAMEKERTDRYASMEEFGRALRTALPGAVEQTYLFGPPKAAAASPATRRKLVRAPYVTPIRLVVDGVNVDGRCEDISTGGLLLICHAACAADRRASLRFALPIEGNVVAVDVHVRWVRAARVDDPDGRRAIGVEFIDPPTEVVASIARYVGLMSAERARGEPPQ